MFKFLLVICFSLAQFTFLFAQEPVVITQQKNLETIVNFEYSEDGKYIASVDNENNDIKIWDVRSSKLIGSLHNHEKKITAITFHPNGQQLYSADKDNNHFIWDLNTWTLKDSAKTSFETKKAKFTPDGLDIVIIDSQNKLFKLDAYDIRAKRDKKSLPAAVNDISIYGDLVAISLKNSKILIVDTRTMITVDEIATKSIKNLDFIGWSKSNMIGVSKSGEIYKFNVRSYQLEDTYETNVKCELASINRNKSYVSLTSDNGSAFIYDFITKKQIAELSSENEEDIKCLRFSPAGNTIATSSFKESWLNKTQSSNNVINIWDIKNQKIIKSLEGHVSSIDAFAFNPTVNALYSLNGLNLDIWDLNKGERHVRFKLQEKTNRDEPEIEDEEEEEIESDEEIADAKDKKKGDRLNKLKGLKLSDISVDNAIGKAEDKASEKVNKVKTNVSEKISEKSNGLILKYSQEKNKLVISKKGKYLITKLEKDDIKLYTLEGGIPVFSRIIETEMVNIQNVVIDPTENYLAITGIGPRSLEIVYLGNLSSKSNDYPFYKDQNAAGVSKRRIKALCFDAKGEYLVVQTNQEEIVAFYTSSWTKKATKESKFYSKIRPYVGFDETGENFYFNTYKGVITQNFEAFISKNTIVDNWATGTTRAYMKIDGALVQNENPIGQIVTKRNGYLEFVNLKAETTVESTPVDRGIITNVKINKFGYVGVSLKTGELKIFDPVTGKERFIMVSEDENAIFKTADNYYKVTKEGQELVSFRVGKDAYPFEQFDAKFNRPDIVLKAMNSEDETLVDLYKKAYEKRLSKLGLTESELGNITNIPTLNILNVGDIPLSTDGKKVSFTISSETKTGQLQKLMVWINDVPVLGSNGKAISGTSYSGKIDLNLACGINKIQFAAINNKGIESLKETVKITCTKKIKPNLYLLSIGTSTYKDARYNLNYAAKDADDLSAFFNQSSDVYGKVFTKTITNEQATTLAIINAKDFFKDATIDDIVIVFVAGHGLLDANYDYFYGTHDIDFDKPGGKGLAYTVLEGLLDGIAPLKKIMIMDTCHSGEVEKDDILAGAVDEEVEGDVMFRAVGPALATVNGVSPSMMMKELFSDLRRGTGTTVISSAGGAEYAMEKGGKYKNGLFTYCLKLSMDEGIADLNGDGKIMLSELQIKVPELVHDLSGGKQNPNTRMQNIALDYQIW
ncbi:MAG: WD40 repeat protein [Parvicella sp.]|jgi:WD40 repeat protein